MRCCMQNPIRTALTRACQLRKWGASMGSIMWMSAGRVNDGSGGAFEVIFTARGIQCFTYPCQPDELPSRATWPASSPGAALQTMVEPAWRPRVPGVGGRSPGKSKARARWRGYGVLARDADAGHGPPGGSGLPAGRLVELLPGGEPGVGALRMSRPVLGTAGADAGGAGAGVAGVGDCLVPPRCRPLCDSLAAEAQWSPVSSGSCGWGQGCGCRAGGHHAESG